MANGGSKKSIRRSATSYSLWDKRSWHPVELLQLIIHIARHDPCHGLTRSIDDSRRSGRACPRLLRCELVGGTHYGSAAIVAVPAIVALF